jgi:hypothetical protein
VKSPLLFAAALLVAPGARANNEFTVSRNWVHLNGYSYHINATDTNDRLFGIGLTRYRRMHGRIVPAWEADLFQDSARKLSAYAGHSWTIPTRHLSFGATGAIMYHRNFASQNDARLLPVAFPFIETRGSRWKARVYYVVPLRNASDQQIAFQLMLPFSR